MLDRQIEWVKQNKLASVLLVIIAYFLLSGGSSIILELFGSRNMAFSPSQGSSSNEMMADYAMKSSGSSLRSNLPSIGGVAPQMNVENRMVVTNSNLSLLVKDVRESIKQIESKTEDVRGYMVKKNITTPQGIERGNIDIRVPSKDLEDVLDSLRGLSVRVVSENINGRDVTDQYMDIEARLATLQRNKARFEEIMNSAVKVDEILRVQTQIMSIQDQIDRYKGQMIMLESTSNSSLVTIYLSTDEIALPYAPSQPWRPDIIFKKAVRALVTDLRGLGSTAIWITVYAVIWVPAVGVFIAVRHFWKNRKKDTSMSTPK